MERDDVCNRAKVGTLPEYLELDPENETGG